MEQSDSIRNTDLKIVALLAVMLVCLLALIVLLFHDTSVAESRMRPMLSAHAAALKTEPAPRSPAAGSTGQTKGAAVTPEENWAADDSAHGMRPDAAH